MDLIIKKKKKFSATEIRGARYLSYVIINISYANFAALFENLFTYDDTIGADA